MIRVPFIALIYDLQRIRYSVVRIGLIVYSVVRQIA
jgi:hypothetical protein